MASHNESYIESLIRQFEDIPKEAAVEAATHAFRQVVKLTIQDSGNAAANWHIDAYTGDYSEPEFQGMWGTGPVGHKGDSRSGTGSEAAVIMWQYEKSLDFELQASEMDFTRIAVYNPVSNTTSPLDGSTIGPYEDNALGNISVGVIEQEALDYAEAQIKMRYGNKVIVL